MTLNREDLDELVKAKTFDQDELQDLILTSSNKIIGDKDKQEQIFASALEECEKLGYEKDSLVLSKIQHEIISLAMAGDDQEKAKEARKE